jgi:hypothetical protein
MTVIVLITDDLMIAGRYQALPEQYQDRAGGRDNSQYLGPNSTARQRAQQELGCRVRNRTGNSLFFQTEQTPNSL